MKFSRDFLYLAIIAVLIALCGQLIYSYKYVPATERRIAVYYNHDTEANRKIIEAVQNADRFIYFAVYTFTRTDIKDALLGAKHRGLEVRGVTDKDQLAKIDVQGKIIRELRAAGIPVAVQDHLGIMHLKTVVTDKSYVSGSYNWTAAATTLNDEVIEVGSDEGVRVQYEHVLRELLGKYEEK
jgi:phosphatidylserine/phosphatidylglycerophosphate/cardiolipin synthase-like enzyme